MDVVDVALDDLRPHPRNPRKITAARLEQLGRTLEAERDMLQARPVIALPDGTVIAGNQRLAAARALGWDSIPTVYADLDERQQTRWMLLDNRGFGEDVAEDVAVLLAELDTAGDDLGLTGYDPADVDRLLASIAKPTGDPEAVPDPPAVPSSVRGEVYELGPHRVMCGDSTSESDVSKLLDEATPTLGLADPPYNVGEDYQTYEDRLDDPEYARFSTAWFELLRASTGRQIVTPGWVNLSVWASLFRFRAIGAWTKSNAMTRGSISRFNTWEPLLFFGSEWPRERAHDVFDFPAKIQPGGAGSPINGVAHPCPKPVDLWADLITNYADGSVFDPFGGAGTVVIAAERVGATAFAMELDPSYVDVIRQRYADYTNQPNLAP